jgi:hypothetical protein
MSSISVKSIQSLVAAPLWPAGRIADLSPSLRLTEGDSDGRGVGGADATEESAAGGRSGGRPAAAFWGALEEPGQSVE